MQVELEAKFLGIDKPTMRTALKACGFGCTQPEFTMRRKTMHFPESINMGNRWGRVREEGDKVTMSIKWVRDAEALDGTLESETTVPTMAAGVAFLESCGLTVTSFQENLRETWHNADKTVMITLDTWPALKTFVEIEATTQESLVKTAQALGLDMNDALFGSVDYIYEKELGIDRNHFITLKEVTFDHPPKA